MAGLIDSETASELIHTPPIQCSATAFVPINVWPASVSPIASVVMKTSTSRFGDRPVACPRLVHDSGYHDREFDVQD